jgi:hypothetical protein
MRRWFERAARPPSPDTGSSGGSGDGIDHHADSKPRGLGETHIAWPATARMAVPVGCIGIAILADGSSRRYASGQIMPVDQQNSQQKSPQKSFWVHAGPYHTQLCLHPSTPEIGLKIQFVLDSPDPRASVQRFDLFLASEIERDLSLAAMQARLENGLQAELAAGGLECGACMSLPEWMRFRAQLERWLYTRFGFMIEDCALVDLGEQIDYAQILLQRAADLSVTATTADAVLPEELTMPQTQAQAQSPAVPEIPEMPETSAGWRTRPTRPTRASHDPGIRDAAQLRRLFLELPDFTARWRAINPPGGYFSLQQTTAQRLSLLKAQVSAMPALAWASPQQGLTAAQINIRSGHMQQAIAAWEQAWFLLARLTQAEGDAEQWQRERDEIDRILANLETTLAARAALPEGQGI